MKQSIRGQRVPNWHKPLPKHEFSQRYRRLSQAPLAEDLDTEAEAHHGIDCCCRVCYDGEDHYDFAYKPDLIKQEIRNCIWRENSDNLQSLIPATVWDRLGAVKNHGGSTTPQLRKDRIPSEELALELLKFATFFDVNYQTAHVLPESLREFLKDQTNLATFRNLSEGAFIENPRFLMNVLLLQPFWVRDAQTWTDPMTDVASRQRSLIDHLFVIYPVPPVFYTCWNQKNVEPQAAWLQWFFLAAQGASIQSASQILGWEIPRKFAHYLMMAPGYLSFDAACTWAEMSRLGISNLSFGTVHNWNAFLLNPVVPPPKRKAVEYSRQTLLWLDQHCKSYSAADFELVVDWAIHLVTEVERSGEIQFEWHGRSPARVLDASREYEASRYRPAVKLRWKQKGWDWTGEDEAGHQWTITELCNGTQLLEEGQAMRHCVAGYAHACVNGNTAIFSLKCQDERKVTIELATHSKEIRQAKGKCNRQTTRQEQAIIEVWLQFLRSIR
ncbi:MAG: PcfJ domain-containing protein [Bacteroidetes bacterium]|nr:PcfJ domain-containing protein [Bacteroidota bacterium]